MMKKVRRPIAGATCPKCGSFDKLFVVDDGERTACECIACGFYDIRPNDLDPESPEYKRGLGQPRRDQPQVVRFVEP